MPIMLHSAYGSSAWAKPRDLIGLVLRHCLRLSGMGVIIGLIASFPAARTVSTLLYDTSPLDPATFAAVSLTLILFALGASVIPIWRVIHIDPVTSLKAE